jgi:hypothetical protein
LEEWRRTRRRGVGLRARLGRMEEGFGLRRRERRVFEVLLPVCTTTMCVSA